MAFMGGLKITYVLHVRGLRSQAMCYPYNLVTETHLHLFFECPFIMVLIRELLQNGSFFLLLVSLASVWEAVNELQYFAIINLCYLIVDVLIYNLWKERNRRLYQVCSTGMDGIYIYKISGGT